MAIVLELPSLRKVPLISGSSGLVSRDEVVTVFDRLVEAAKPAYKISLPALPIESAALISKRAEVKQAMTRLVRGGFISRVDPLLCGPGDNLEPEIFGDDIGYLLARVAELSHMPSSKWSPYLQPPGG